MSNTAESTIVIRDIESISEMRDVEDLQIDVWGMEERDIVSLTQLVAAKETGGVLVGAFDGDLMVGFVYGFVGYEGGRLTIHSHMLAVKPAYRNRQLGYRLKLAQRERALAQGITTVTWTFDPLQSSNAHLNFAKLGVVSDGYKINFYGEETSSFLHRIGTDRLWLSWLLNSQRVRQRVEQGLPPEQNPPELGSAPRLVQLGADDVPQRVEVAQGLAEEHVVIEIPRDINALQQQNPELAVQWREATRWAFMKAMAAGYLVEEFYRLTRSGQQLGAYFLSLGKRVEDFI